jgi:hypothetical protein
MSLKKRPDFPELERVEVLLIKSKIRNAYIRAEFRLGAKQYKIDFLGGDLTTAAMERMGVDPDLSYRPFWDVFLEIDGSNEVMDQIKSSLCGQLLYGAYQVVGWKE